MKTSIKTLRRVSASLALVGASVLANSAQAAVDISADITAAKADIASNGALIMGVVVAIAAFFWVRRIVK